MAIKEWVAADRPREKLIQRGARNLTDSELLVLGLVAESQQGNWPAHRLDFESNHADSYLSQLLFVRLLFAWVGE